MEWPWVSRARLRVVARVCHDVEVQLRAERAEVKRLTDVIIKMRDDRFRLAPQDSEEAWPDGKYAMDEAEAEMLARTPNSAANLEESFTESDLSLAAEVEDQMARDFQKFMED